MSESNVNVEPLIVTPVDSPTILHVMNSDVVALSLSFVTVESLRSTVYVVVPTAELITISLKIGASTVAKP